jgi:hypothetical protein
MKKVPARKLVLKKDTIRVMQPQQLKGIVGGALRVSGTCCACTHHCVKAY